MKEEEAYHVCTGPAARREGDAADVAGVEVHRGSKHPHMPSPSTESRGWIPMLTARLGFVAGLHPDVAGADPAPSSP